MDDGLHPNVCNYVNLKEDFLICPDLIEAI